MEGAFPVQPRHQSAGDCPLLEAQHGRTDDTVPLLIRRILRLELQERKETSRLVKATVFASCDQGSSEFKICHLKL